MKFGTKLYKILLIFFGILLLSNISFGQIPPKIETDTVVKDAIIVKKIISQENNFLTKNFKVQKILWFALLFLLAYLFISAIIKFSKYLLKKKTKPTPQGTNLKINENKFLKLINIFLWFVAFVLIILLIKPSEIFLIILLLTFSVIFVISSQQIFTNYLSGIKIFIQNKYKKGDKISINNHSGEIINLGFHSTIIQISENEQISIPNKDLLNSKVAKINSLESKIPVELQFYFNINSDTKKLKEIVKNIYKITIFASHKNEPEIFFDYFFENEKEYLKTTIIAYAESIKTKKHFKSKFFENLLGKLISNGYIAKK